MFGVTEAADPDSLTEPAKTLSVDFPLMISLNLVMAPKIAFYLKA
jgi:hypothetical protein